MADFKYGLGDGGLSIQHLNSPGYGTVVIPVVGGWEAIEAARAELWSRCSRWPEEDGEPILCPGSGGEPEWPEGCSECGQLIPGEYRMSNHQWILPEHPPFFTAAGEPKNAERPCPNCHKPWMTDADNLHPDMCPGCGWVKGSK